MPEINTIEEARAEILRLQEENATLTGERDVLSQNNNELTEELTRVRSLNQTFYNKLIAQYPTGDGSDDPDEEDVAPSCEEFAKTLDI